MKINFTQFLLFSCCCLLMACQTETKSTPAPGASTNTPTAVPPKPGTVATPANISRPDKMTNNFQRMQGEWQQVEDNKRELQVRGKVFLEIERGSDNAELANQFKVVKNCEGTIDVDGEFFMVGKRCYKLLKISIEEMEIEELEQQKVIKYIRI